MFMDKYLYYFKDMPLDIYVKKSTAKNLIIKINSENEIVVSRPSFVNDKQLDDFINLHLEWAYKHQSKNIKNTLFSYEEKFVYIFGKRHIIQVNEGYSSNKLIVKNNVIYAMVEVENEKLIVELIDEYLLNKLDELIRKNQSDFINMMKTSLYDSNIEKRTSTWGVNYGREKKIVYNSKLSHYPEEVINYVIIHELAHDFQRNHSDKFWQIVEQYLPDYQEKRNVLRNNKDVVEE